jgi:hypothetical protein
VVGLTAGALMLSLVRPAFISLVPVLMMIFFLLNHRLLRFLLEKRGVRFFSAAFLLHHLYFFYSGTTFLLCWCRYRLFEKTGKGGAKRLKLS